MLEFKLFNQYRSPRHFILVLFCMIFAKVLSLSTPTLSFHKHRNYVVRNIVKMTNSITNVKVTTYNVLSTQLGGADYYRACDPKWLDSKHRLRKLKEKLDIETNSNAIICLQEVSNQCASILHPYFLRKNYYFMTGKWFNIRNNDKLTMLLFVK